ncbi:MAG TPA: protein kinase [Candidatus Binatia bacterium]|nr:protein kinase [Candidatus Binatia bacterium]
MSLDRVARVFEHPSFRERYDVADRIGSGSFAQVYRAVQRSTGQDVAVKILTLDVRPDADPIQLQIARFRREVQLCAYLRHPNIVRLMDSGQPYERVGTVHDAGTQSARAREILDTSLVSPGSNPMRILARGRDALARMGSC